MTAVFLTTALGSRLPAHVSRLTGDASRLPSQSDTTRLHQAVQRIESLLTTRMRDDQVPGGAVILTGRDGFSRIITAGVADLQTIAPVNRHTLFEAGSLSKTVTALALLQMREEGLVELNRGIDTYLPWFRLPPPSEVMTLHQLLTHTAGLPRDRDDIPSSPYTAAGLRERIVEVRPGRRFAYSNLGYQLISLLMEEVEGRAFAEVIRRRVFAPSGMDSSAAAITNALRPRLATGYQYYFDDRPPHSGHPVVPATWAEHGAGDANVALTPHDLGLLLLSLLSEGNGVRGRVIDRKNFELIARRAVAAPPLGSASRYGYGLIVDSLDGRVIQWNSGGTLGFRSYLLADHQAGLAVGVLMNGPGNARRVAEFAWRTLLSVQAGRPLPPLPEMAPPTQIGNAAEYAGDFTGVLGDSVRFEADGNTLLAVLPEGRIALERLGRDQFYANTERFALFPIGFGRDSSGSVVEVSYGGEWFAGERHRGPRSFEYPREWVAYLGHYRSSIPWYNNFRVIVRKGVLLLVAPEGTEELLVPARSPGAFRIGPDPDSPELLEFDTVISGRALRATLSGVAYYRSFTP